MARLSQAELIQGLARIVGEQHLSTARPDRVAYSADFWPKAQIWKLGGDVERYPPDCVVWPADEAEVARVLRFCHDHLIPVIPYGGGSGVCGGTIPLHGGVVVDVKRLGRLTAVDAVSRTVVAEAGVNGQQLEDRLNALGYTLGHFPSSIMCSTLGGWLAARSAGQFSSRYGKIEDMVLSLRVVFPDGTVLDTGDRGAGSPDWTQLICGSEGTLGVITAAELKVEPRPEARELRAWRFRHLADGLRGARAVMQAGLRPIVLRLYDPFDSLIALGKDKAHGAPPSEVAAPGRLDALRQLFSATGARVGAGAAGLARHLEPLARAAKRSAVVGALSTPALTNRLANAAPASCLMITGFEGPAEAVQAEAWAANALLAEAGGVDAGPRPAEAWLARRYHVSFKQSGIYELGGFVDTMEVASTWDRLDTMYEAVRRALSPHVFVMAHFSHAYREGCSIYFTFAGHRHDPKKAEQLYDRVWKLGTEAVSAAGGTVSHHHGVGMSKMDAMVREHGPMLRVWRALKDAVDPHGVMNPGKLFPAAAAAEGADADAAGGL